VKFTILIPHYKTGMMTAYSVAQLLKYKGNHEVDILVIDNNAGDGSANYLMPFMKDITIIEYPKDRLQSHGIAFEYVLPEIQTEWFLTMESDSFPTVNHWLDYYEDVIKSGFDAAGSKLKLSGGEYLHPCGAIYKKSVWEDAKKYCMSIPYKYYPNMSMRDNFANHLMIHNSLVDELSENPADWVELSSEYKGNTKQIMKEKQSHYEPVAIGPFHQGMGIRQESVRTYGSRTIESESPYILFTGKEQKLIGRVGLEPGQWFTYYMAATNKKMYFIPTTTKWMEGRMNQQQDFTFNVAGFKHLWGISAYHNYTPDSEKDIAQSKQSIPEQLYNTLPIHQKIH